MTKTAYVDANWLTIKLRGRKKPRPLFKRFGKIPRIIKQKGKVVCQYGHIAI